MMNQTMTLCQLTNDDLKSICKGWDRYFTTLTLLVFPKRFAVYIPWHVCVQRECHLTDSHKLRIHLTKLLPSVEDSVYKAM